MKVSVSDLSHHPLNEDVYLLSDIDDLVSSIDEMGLLQPLVINSRNQVISGNRRLKAVQRLKWTEVDVEPIDIDPEDELITLVHYNKHRVKTYREILKESKILMGHYSKGQGFRSDLTSVQVNKSSSRDQIAFDTGIPSSTIGKLFFIDKYDSSFIDLIDSGDLSLNQAYNQVRRVKNEKDTIFSQTKNSLPSTDLYRFYEHSSDHMPELEEQSVDLIFTSPPYWKKRTYTTKDEIGSESSSDEFINNLVRHFGDCKRVLKETGSMFVVLGDTFYEGCLQSIPHRFALGLVDTGWILRNTIIWSKTNPKPQSSKNNLTPTYEFIFHFVKTNDYKYEHTLDVLKHPNSDARVPRHRGITQRKVSPYLPRGGKNMGDFWNEDIVRSTVARNLRTETSLEHPAPFPHEIVRLPILQTTVENDLVLDPFMGSGTTGSVANEMGRRFVGYDIRSY